MVLRNILILRMLGILSWTNVLIHQNPKISFSFTHYPSNLVRWGYRPASSGKKWGPLWGQSVRHVSKLAKKQSRSRLSLGLVGSTRSVACDLISLKAYCVSSLSFGLCRCPTMYRSEVNGCTRGYFKSCYNLQLSAEYDIGTFEETFRNLISCSSACTSFFAHANVWGLPDIMST